MIELQKRLHRAAAQAYGNSCASFGAGDVDIEHVRRAERALRAASERYDQTARQLGLPTNVEELEAMLAERRA